MQSLKSNRIYEHTVAIKKDKNWFSKATLRRFDPLVWWHLLKAPMVSSEYINKSVGISERLNPHRNSLRLGWRRDNDLVIHWYIYSYNDGVRSIHPLEVFRGMEELFIRFKTISSEVSQTNELAMEISMPNNPAYTQTIIVPFKPKWFTSFYWGGEPFPNTSDSFWYKSNLNGRSKISSFVDTAFSYSPLLASIVPAIAMLLLIVLIAQLSTQAAVIFSILLMVSFLGFVLRNFINYERWLYRIDRLLNRIRRKPQETS